MSPPFPPPNKSPPRDRPAANGIMRLGQPVNFPPARQVMRSRGFLLRHSPREMTMCDSPPYSPPDSGFSHSCVPVHCCCRVLEAKCHSQQNVGRERGPSAGGKTAGRESKVQLHRASPTTTLTLSPCNSARYGTGQGVLRRWR